MAADISLRMKRRQPAEGDFCPLECKSVRLDPQTSVFRLNKKSHTGSSPEDRQEENKTPFSEGGIVVTTETGESSEDELGRLDIDLDRKSKQHNLTSSNVRAILHEVITHERVVAMMKTAIRDTKDLPMFEPKMTRARLKQVIQQGQSLNWSLPALDSATVQLPQFVDIELDEDEDSSDEEYCPDEEEEDDDEEEDTTDEMFLSDGDSLASPPRTLRPSQTKLPEEQSNDGTHQSSPGPPGEPVRTSTCPSQPLLAPPESSFLERLNAVQEELDCNPASHQPLSATYTCNQSLHRQADDNEDERGSEEGSGGLAYRTRSKLRLENVPLGQLEAELLAPDITDDMYEQGPVQRAEDRRWTKWLQGLMVPENEEEVDDEDDPEYNFLDDLDEPDVEDYRTDRAVQITKKEVNQLLDELFVTLQDEEHLEEKSEITPSQNATKFNVPKALRFEAPLASLLTERRRTVRQQYEAQQQKRALQDATNQLCNNMHLNRTPAPQDTTSTPILLLNTCSPLYLDNNQKLQLQQQIQQHVQLLTQIHLLARRVECLKSEACITKNYLDELQQFSKHKGAFFPSSFRACNLQGALDLLQEVEQKAGPPPAPPAPPAPAASRRWLPRMTPATNSLAFPLLPADTAWLFATRSVFLYPELLPVCNLEATNARQQRNVYTAGEDGLIVLGLKHFEGTVEPDQQISSYLLRKTKWSFRKHVREMSGTRAPHNSVIKMFLSQGVVPPLPLACSRVDPADQRPPVDRDTTNMPNWLKNSQLIIQKTRLNSTSYPPSLPLGCTLRLHPYWLGKSAPRAPRHKRLFKLAHNASLLPLAKAPGDGQAHVQPISLLPPPPSPGVTILSYSPTVSGALTPLPSCEVVPVADVHTSCSPPASPDFPGSCHPTSQRMQGGNSVETCSSAPLLLPLASPHPDITSPIIPCSAAALKPGYFVVNVVMTPPALPIAPPISLHIAASTERPIITCQHALEPKHHPSIKKQISTTHLEEIQEEKVEESSTATLTQSLSRAGQKEEEDKEKEEREVEAQEIELEKEDEKEEEELTAPGLVSLNGEEKTGGEEEEAREGGGADGAGEEDASGGGEGEQGGEEEEEDEEGQRQDGGGEREEDGEKDKDEDQDHQGEEEEEDFDDLTQDEDEEEVMSSASEESVLSVPELQETMKQLTWLAAERRLCADGDSEEDHSPTSPGSQEEEEEEEEEVPKEEESGEGRSTKEGGDEDLPSEEGTPRGGGSRAVRGRGRNRPPRALRRSRQERHSVDAAKLLLLYDDNILDNDPYRESKDTAFAKSYLNRVREALQEVPEQVEEFVSLLSKFEQAGEGQEVMMLFRRLRCILGNRTDLLKDFAAFLHPEQALQCGLFEEQQVYERSRRFLRQLEISFGENPSHYQKIIKALQTGPDLSPASIHELKAQMATLLKGHTHLQNEFWVFFDELRPPPAHPGQFEQAHWPEDGGGGSDGAEGFGQVSGGGPCSGFEEVTLPDLEDEEEGQKIPPLTSRRQRRKMDTHRNYKDCDWSDKDWSCLCSDSKIRRHRRKGCPRCHSSKTSGVVPRAMKRLGPLYSRIGSALEDQGDKDTDLKGDSGSPQPVRSSASWEGSFPLIDEKEEEEEEDLEEDEDDYDEDERKNSEKEQSPIVKRSRREETLQPPITYMNATPSVTASTSTTSMISNSWITSSASSSMTSEPIVTSCQTSQPIVTSSQTSQPSVTSSLTSQPSVMSSMTSKPIVSTSLTSQPSVTTSLTSQPSVTTSLTSQPSVTTSLTSQPSVTTSLTSQPSVTTSPTSQPSVTTSPTSQPAVTSSLSSNPSVTSHSCITSSMTSQPSSTSDVLTSTSLTSVVSSPISSSGIYSTSASLCTSSTLPSSPPAPPRPGPPPDLPVCAKNISLTASGEKVILWTREADRVILTTCQQEGANQNTFEAISAQLGNKTPNEVSRRFRDLMRLFRTAARQSTSEEEAPPAEIPATNKEED